MVLDPVTIGIAMQGVQMGIGAIAGKKQRTEQRRATRDQVRQSNQEILRQIEDIGRGAAREDSSRLLAAGAAGLTGGGVTTAQVMIDAARQRFLDQEMLARGISTQSLQAGEKAATARAANLFLGADEALPTGRGSLFAGLGLRGFAKQFNAFGREPSETGTSAPASGTGFASRNPFRF